MHVRVVVALAHPIGTDSAQREFPRVDVRIHKAGKNDVIAAVDDLRVGSADIGTDSRDFFAVDQYVTALDTPKSGIHRDDDGIPDERPCHIRVSR